MPVSFSGRGANVTGGARAAQFIRDNILLDGAAAARLFISLFPMGRLRSAVPVRTGALQRSLRHEQHGNQVFLRGQWYGRLITTTSGGTLRDLYLQLILETLRGPMAGRWYTL